MDGIVVDDVPSKQEGPKSIHQGGPSWSEVWLLFMMFSRFTSFTSFLPQSRDMQVRWTGHTVCMNVFLYALCVKGSARFKQIRVYNVSPTILTFKHVRKGRSRLWGLEAALITSTWLHTNKPKEQLNVSNTACWSSINGSRFLFPFESAWKLRGYFAPVQMAPYYRGLLLNAAFLAEGKCEVGRVTNARKQETEIQLCETGVFICLWGMPILCINTLLHQLLWNGHDRIVCFMKFQKVVKASRHLHCRRVIFNLSKQEKQIILACSHSQCIKYSSLVSGQTLWRCCSPYSLFMNHLSGAVM